MGFDTMFDFRFALVSLAFPIFLVPDPAQSTWNFHIMMFFSFDSLTTMVATFTFEISYHHSNCLEMFKKAYTKAMPFMKQKENLHAR